MDPFARKMLLGALAFATAMALMAGTLSAIYLHGRPTCHEAMVTDSASPDSRWKAVVLERRCGEDKPFYVHVNLTAAADPIRVAFFSGRSEEGEVFLAEEETRDTKLELVWSSPTELKIRCAQCRANMVRRKDPRWNNIDLRYELGR